MSDAVRRDGFIDGCVAGPNIKICLVIAPNRDFHFYRLFTSSGVWGHKPGSTAALLTDASGNIITNPETCDRGIYTEFCGYFYADTSVPVN